MPQNFLNLTNSQKFCWNTAIQKTQTWIKDLYWTKVKEERSSPCVVPIKIARFHFPSRKGLLVLCWWTSSAPTGQTDRHSNFWLAVPGVPFAVCWIICALESWIRGFVCPIAPGHSALQPQTPTAAPVVLSSSKQGEWKVYHHTVLCSLSSSAGNEFFWQHRKPVLHPPGYLLVKVEEK